jgi:uncharacterized protein
VGQFLASGANVNSVDYDGNSALVYAARFGNNDMVAQLLAAGADARTSYAGLKCCMALIEAARKGHVETVNLLLLIADHRDYDMALTVTAKNGHLRVVEILLNAGASVDNAIMYKESVLHMVRQWLQG